METSEGKETVKKIGITHYKINQNWLLVLQIIKKLEESEYNIKAGKTVFQMICYILTRYGTDLDLKFKKGKYGIYSNDISRMITVLSNCNLIRKEKHENTILIMVDKSFRIDNALYSENDINNARMTFQLFKRVKNTYQLIMITDILLTFDTLHRSYISVTENMIYDYIVSLNNKYRSCKNELRIRELTKSLTSMKLIEIDYTRDFADNFPF